MAFFNINNREIRSFKLYKQTADMNSFFLNKNQNGLFMMCDSLHPKDRIQMRGDLAQYDLKIKIIPKNIIHFLFENDKKEIQNLLKGNVVLVTTNNEKNFEENHFKYLLKQEKMSIRFLLWNGVIYRENKIKDFINSLNVEKHKSSVLTRINKPANILINNILPYNVKSNYTDKN